MYVLCIIHSNILLYYFDLSDSIQSIHMLCYRHLSLTYNDVFVIRMSILIYSTAMCDCKCAAATLLKLLTH